MLEGPGKLFRYLKNIYLDNPKFSHTVLSDLKIYFERNIKSNKSFSPLGQIYSSSKWSPFSKSNIKVSLRQSFSYFIIPFLASLGLLHAVSGKTTFYETFFSFVDPGTFLCS